MITLGSKSYPYLAIAQHYGIDYGEVLSFSDIVENKKLALDVSLHKWQCAVLDAWYNERERRKQVSGV